MSQSGFQALIQELRRRRVFRVATLYVVSFWPVLQVVDILSPALNISDATMKNLLLYFVLGFPIAIVIAWLYNLTPKGLVKNDGEEVEEERLIGNRLELVVIVFCVTLAGVLFTFQDQFFDLTAENQANLQSAAPQEQTYESIAVLPFTPFSDDKQDEYFADGLAEELLNVLAKIQSLQVAARTSSFAYKGAQDNIQRIGRELGVDVILEGSVRRNDINNTVRVTAQLIDVRTGTHIWSETYDRQFKDIFKIQDEITEAVVGELKIALLGEQKDQLWAHETANPEAMIAHSQGRTELAKRTGSAIRLAKEYFEDAVSKDPNYATAYASLAESNVLLIGYDNADKKEHMKLAQEAVDKAMSIDGNLGLAWAAQGLIYMTDEETADESRAALKKAIELNPSYAMAYMWYGSMQDDFQKSTELYEKAFKLDPMSPVAGYNLANNLIMMGRDEDAMEVFSNIVDADPFYPNAYFLIGQINAINGRIDQAIVNYKKSYDLGDFSKSGIILADLYTDLGDIEKARYWLSKIPYENLEERREYKWMDIIHDAYEDDWTSAKAKLTEFATIKEEEKDNAFVYMDAMVANYFLEDFKSVIKSYEIAKDLDTGHGLGKMGKSAIKKRYDNLVYAAFAYHQMEKPELASEVIAEFRKIHQENVDAGFRVMPIHWYLMGLINVIEGEDGLGMVSIQRAVDQGWISPFLFDNEIILRDLKSTPEYIEIKQSIHTRVRILKEKLAYEDKFTSL